MEIFEKDIQYLKGVGPNRKVILNKLGIFNIGDLLSYFPRDYQNRSKFKKIQEVFNDELVCIKAFVYTRVKEIRIRKNLTMYKLEIKDETGNIECTWFNNRFVKEYFIENEEYVFFGKINRKNGKVYMMQPEYEKVDENFKTGKIVPIYSLTENITQNAIRKDILQALKLIDNSLPETMPEYILKESNLKDINYSIKNIHYPESNDSFFQARTRLVFEELLGLQLLLLTLKNGYSKKYHGIQFKNVSTDEIMNTLSFTLTEAQKRVLEEIFNDMESDKCMNRLLQGDVGSGKTVVAAIAMYKAIKSGYQCTLMAPTSILAQQHYQTIKKTYDILGLKIELLVGSTTKKQKEIIIDRLKNGDIDVLIGTHAIIEDNIEFKNLGLIITDEQHRFGVRQRQKLSQKGENADVIIMTATPIPRTLALILYGDMDVSVIDQLPPGRQKIDTFAVTKDKAERVNDFIIKNVNNKNQAYIVCPLVEDSELITAKSVEEMYEYYRQKLNGCRVSFLHGKMKNKEKTEIMKEFKEGLIDVLISTTVIEVGVDVPNATMMIIENAERFRLSSITSIKR